MQGEMFPTRIEYSSEFRKNLKRLSKKYRQIRSDLEPLIEQLQNRQLPGDRVQVSGHEIYKERVKNSDLNKGKSAGYRVIYWLRKHDLVVLLSIYSKSDQPDIKQHQIEQLIREMDT